MEECRFTSENSLLFSSLQRCTKRLLSADFFSSLRHSNRCNAIIHILFRNNFLSSSFSHRFPWRRFVCLEASRSFYLSRYSRGLRPRIENVRKRRSRRIDKNLILYLNSTQEMYSRSSKYLITYRFTCILCVCHIKYFEIPLYRIVMWHDYRGYVGKIWDVSYNTYDMFPKDFDEYLRAELYVFLLCSESRDWFSTKCTYSDNFPRNISIETSCFSKADTLYGASLVPSSSLSSGRQSCQAALQGATPFSTLPIEGLIGSLPRSPLDDRHWFRKGERRGTFEGSLKGRHREGNYFRPLSPLLTTPLFRLRRLRRPTLSRRYHVCLVSFF